MSCLAFLAFKSSVGVRREETRELRSYFQWIFHSSHFDLFSPRLSSNRERGFACSFDYTVCSAGSFDDAAHLFPLSLCVRHPRTCLTLPPLSEVQDISSNIEIRFVQITSFYLLYCKLIEKKRETRERVLQASSTLFATWLMWMSNSWNCSQSLKILRNMSHPSNCRAHTLESECSHSTRNFISTFAQMDGWMEFKYFRRVSTLNFRMTASRNSQFHLLFFYSSETSSSSSSSWIGEMARKIE